MPRYLGIDHGDSRIGLALSDELGFLAHPLETIHVNRGEDPLARIPEVVAAKQVTVVVLGLPLRMDGSPGTAVEKVRRFAEALKPKLPPDVDLVEVDERLSTVSAMEKLHDAGRKAGDWKGIIDQAAAVEILQDYLDTLAGGPCLLEDDDDESGDYDDEP